MTYLCLLQASDAVLGALCTFSFNLFNNLLSKVYVSHILSRQVSKSWDNLPDITQLVNGGARTEN